MDQSVAGIFIEISKPDTDELWSIHIRLLYNQSLTETPDQEALQAGLQAVPMCGFPRLNPFFGRIDAMDHANQVTSGCGGSFGQQVLGLNLFFVFSFASHCLP
jgi:hypothetical protein